MEEPKSDLLEACKEVLATNQHGDYTAPTGKLYPHQWLWDSCFTAIGLAHYDIERAKKELLSLVRGQWANGMIPNIIFGDSDHHKRDRNLWQSWRNPHAPDKIATTGITQPPMLAEAIVQIGKKMDKPARREWYITIWPALLAYHEWLYRERDPHEEGLVLLIHPWECGLDNTPPWINQLYMHHRPWWVSVVEKTGAGLLVRFVRRDTRHARPEERLSNVDALLYYYVVRRLRRKNWDIDSILNRSHFGVQDLTFNCVLLRAHDHLKSIAKTIGHEIPDWLDERVKKGREHIEEKLWDAYDGQFYSRNFVTHKLIKEPSIATLMPLYAGGISKEQAKRLVELLKSKKHFGTTHPVPTVPVSSAWFKEFGYWQGPTWINTNWLIIDGLKRYKFDEEAEELRLATLALVRENGPFEYFSPKSGKGAGAHNFSWTAALTIDLLGK